MDQRREPRHRVECVRTTAGGEAEEPFAAVLEDVSTFGCRLSNAEALTADSRVWLRLPGSPPVVATVVWAHDGQAGCRFAAPIAQGLMRALLPGAI